MCGGNDNVFDVLTDDIMSLFGIKSFSNAGTTELKKEQATYMMFKDLLEELEGNGCVISCVYYTPIYITVHILYLLNRSWSGDGCI